MLTVMADLIPFEFQGQNQIRVVMASGEPWFVGRDIAGALGYSDESDAIRKHCKGFKSLKNISSGEMPEGLPGNTLMIRDPDVYRLVVRSKLPSAERFEEWVFDEVLPSIRRTGRYETQQITRPQVSALEYVKLIRESLPNLGNAAMQQLFSEDSEIDLGPRLIPIPKVEEKFWTATEIAEELGVTPNKIGRMANANGLKTPSFGEYRLSKSMNGSKQVEQFHYNEAGLAELRKLFSTETCR